MDCQTEHCSVKTGDTLGVSPLSSCLNSMMRLTRFFDAKNLKKDCANEVSASQDQYSERQRGISVFGASQASAMLGRLKPSKSYKTYSSIKFNNKNLPHVLCGLFFVSGFRRFFENLCLKFCLFTTRNPTRNTRHMKRMLTTLTVFVLTAFFIPNLSAYTVTVTNGTPSCNFLPPPPPGQSTITAYPGDPINIKANSSAAPFLRWSGSDADLQLLKDPTNSTTSFDMPARDVSFTAVYYDPHTVTVTNGTASPATASEGETVTIRANPSELDRVFVQWTGSDADLKLLKDPTKSVQSFAMPARDVAFTATYEKIPYEVTVTNGTPSPATSSEGKLITIKAAEIEGQTFLEWAGSTDDLQLLGNRTSSTTSFIMPARDVSISAVYDRPYTVAVTNGTPSSVYPVSPNEFFPNGKTKKVNFGGLVTITANSSETPFLRWSGSDADLQLLGDRTSSTTSFAMPARDVSFTATYSPAPSYTITIAGGGVALNTYAKPPSSISQITTLTVKSGDRIYIASRGSSEEPFLEWAGSPADLKLLGNPKSSSQSFTMPARDVSLTAVYDIPYTVTVTNGVALPATASAGETVQISAPLRPKQVFVQWSGSDADLKLLGDRTSLTTSFTMPARDVSFTAVYDVPHTITVTNGIALPATASAGETVQISAPLRPKQVFVQWSGSDVDLKLLGDRTSLTTSFTMPARDVSFTAVYDVPHTITITNGTASPTTALVGETVTINANPSTPVEVFVQWTGSEDDLKLLGDPKSSNQSFTMPARDVSLTAVFSNRYTVFAINGTASPKNAIEGETVSITAQPNNPSNPDEVFVRWPGSNSSISLLSDPRNQTQTFTMPNRNVEFTATYGPPSSYTVTVTNGTADPTTAYLDSEVTLTANDKPGWKFKAWTGNIELLDADSKMLKSTTFIMPANPVSFTATYEELIWEKGTGEELTPYEIWNRADLELLAIKVNAGNAFADSHFKLMDDIDLADVPTGTDSKWMPIGRYDNNESTEYPFSGNFNGDSHVISNVYVTSTEDAGLFGYTKNVMISNLGVENVEINDAEYAGALIGECFNGNVDTCYVTGRMTATATADGKTVYAGGLIGLNWKGTISNCYAMGTVTATASRVFAGGLIAYNLGRLENCYATGAVTATANKEAYAGGLIGTIEGGSIENCYATGTVTATASRVYAGGLIGHNYAGNISNCYATGAVSATANGDYASYTGGLVGVNEGGSVVSNCYATGDVTATGTGSNAYAGGLLGLKYGGSVENCYATGAATVESDKPIAGGLIGGNDGSVENSYYDQDTTGQSDDDGKGAPLSTREMTTAAFVATLNNFQNPKPWKGLPDSYPRLGWENVITPIIQSGSYIFTQNGGSQFPHDGLSEETAYSFAALLDLSESGKLTADSYTFIFKSGEYKNFALNMPSVKTLYIIFEEGATAGTNGVDPMLELPNAQYVEITGLKLSGVYMTTDRPLILNAPNAEIILSHSDIENNRFAHAPKLINARNAKVKNCKINNNTH